MKVPTVSRSVWVLSTIAATAAGLVVEMAFAWALQGLGGISYYIFGLPFLLLPAAGASLVVTLALVMPAVALAQRARVRWGGAALRWSLPAAASAVAAAVVTVAGLCAALLNEEVAAPSTHLWWWLATTLFVLLAGRPAGRPGTSGPPGAHRAVPGVRGCGGLLRLHAHGGNPGGAVGG